MNGNGLSEKLAKSFPNLIPISRPTRDNNKDLIELSKTSYVGTNLVNQKIYDPCWLIGFLDGVGCFFVKLRKASDYKSGYQVSLKFQITQHCRDSLLLKNIVDYLECGKYRETVNNNDGKFEIESLKDIVKILIPLLDKYPLLGIKHKDYVDFKEVANLMKDGIHLTDAGVKQIEQIKSGMNRERNYE